MTTTSGTARPRLVAWTEPRASVWTLVEVAVVVLVAVAFAAPYLDGDANAVPTGTEYPSAIQPYHFWTRLRECGPCALWNGSVSGGFPAIIDVHAGILHPLAALGTLVGGMPNGPKLALVLSFVVAGLAQWWLGQVLGLGRVARTWGALMAVVAGNLAGRMASGWINLVISGAACAVVFPPLVGLMLQPGKRMATILGLALAGAIVAGQGYLQIGLAVLMPLALVVAEPGNLRQAVGGLARAAATAVLVAAPFLVPLVRHASELGKDIDTAFGAAQPLRYLPLNFVVDDEAFYSTQVLGKAPYAGPYVNYVGWVTVLLAAVGAAGGWLQERLARERRLVLFFVACILASLWLASATPFRWLLALSPVGPVDEIIAGIRNPEVIAGLAIPPVIALASMAVDRLTAAAVPLGSLVLGAEPRRAHRIDLDARWVLALVLPVAVAQAASVNHKWIRTDQMSEHVYSELETLRTEELEWAMPPFGEHHYVEPAVRMGLKLVDDLKPWHWQGHDDPLPLLVASRTERADPTLVQYAQSDGVRFYRGPSERDYALIAVDDDTSRSCRATGIGGHIDVECPSSSGGVLTVKEHTTAGWHATVNGQPASLRPGQWLAVEVPPGEATVQLRYRPWTAALGAILGVVGLVLAAPWLWRGDRPVPTAGDGANEG